MASKHPPAPRQAGFAQGVVLLLASVFPVMGVVLIAPIAPTLTAAFADQPGGRYWAAAALTAPALAIALCSPFIGALVDRWGARRLLIWALFIYAPVGMAPMLMTSLPWLIGARLALGVAEAAIMTAVFVLIAGYFEGAQRIRWIAYKQSFAGFGGTIFYMVGGALAEISWRTTFSAYGLSLIVGLLAIPIIFNPSVRDEQTAASSEAPSKPRAMGTVLALCGLTLLSALFFYIVVIQFAVLLSSAGVKSPAQLGALIAIAGLGFPIGALLYGFMNRVAPGVVMLGAALLAAIGLGAASLAPTPALMVVGAFINQLGCGAFVPIMQAGLMKVLPPTRRGVGGGGWAMAFFAGQFLSPLLVAIALDVTGGARGAFMVFAVGTATYGVAASLALRAVLGSSASGATARAESLGAVETSTSRTPD